MHTSEVKDISDAFAQAWDDFFAQAFFVPFDEVETKKQSDTVYDEVKTLVYKFAEKKPIAISIKELESLDKESAIGMDKKKELALSFVTLRLPEFEYRGIFEFTDNFNVVHYYKVVDEFPRVLFGNTRIFTKLKVAELKNYATGEVM